MPKLNPNLEALAIRLANTSFDGLSSDEIDEKMLTVVSGLIDDDAKRGARARCRDQQQRTDPVHIERIERSSMEGGS